MKLQKIRRAENEKTELFDSKLQLLSDPGRSGERIHMVLLYSPASWSVSHICTWKLSSTPVMDYLSNALLKGSLTVIVVGWCVN